jgi:hypothetical protein
MARPAPAALADLIGVVAFDLRKRDMATTNAFSDFKPTTGQGAGQFRGAR